jgi:succinyl-diaminopimelate desuccinylase
VPRLVRLLQHLVDVQLDKGTAHFEPSNLELTTIDVGNPAVNVIPAQAHARFNVRFNDLWTPESLAEVLRKELDRAADGHAYSLTFAPNPARAFLTGAGRLTEEIGAAIRDVAGAAPSASTNGGTSDARFFKDVCPVVEFGLVGETMHQVDERVPLAELTKLTAIYRRFLDIHFTVAGR